MALAVGSRLAHYDVTALIGEGGMGQVYQATDTKLERTVALKVLPQEFAEDPDRLQRFNREAKAASAISHPHVAHIYEIGEADGTHYIAMEFVEGQTLADKLQGHSLNLEQFIELTIQVADALDEAHRRGLVHRDIKPGNVMVDGRGHAKVLDFGIAKFVHPEVPSTTSSATTATGTNPGMVLSRMTAGSRRSGSLVHRLQASLSGAGCVNGWLRRGRRALPRRGRP